jgi:hypothetical protein
MAERMHDHDFGHNESPFVSNKSNSYITVLVSLEKIPQVVQRKEGARGVGLDNVQSL